MSSRIIESITVRDIRFPTSLEKDGSDATNKAPDYSCAYVTITTRDGLQGYGITFTLGRGNDIAPDYSCAYVTITVTGGLEGYGITFTAGRGNEIVCEGIKLLRELVIGKDVDQVLADFGQFWWELTNAQQIRWLGPDKGVMHMAVAAICNALWDMWARIEGKPLWKLLVDMSPEQLVSTIDFKYLGDALTKEEAKDILEKMIVGKQDREMEMKENGFPAYTTSCGWLGYSEEKITRLLKESQDKGFTRFKAKVGADLEDDKRRLKVFREKLSPDHLLMVDANQKWEVQEAIDWMKELAQFGITWIEEPTSPDDILGHLQISQALASDGIGVATGEQCQNKVMFKQFLKSGAMQFCQIDSCRLGGVSENLAVILMAKKYGVPVCPHAGGVGLCEYVQHLAIFDYVSVSGSLDKRMCEYTDHLHEHFYDPARTENGCYVTPEKPGYSIEMYPESLDKYEWPAGGEWKRLIAEGLIQP